MSTTYHIECDDCKRSLWIGQRDFIYFGEEDTMKKLQGFLYEHHTHPLGFRSDHKSRYMNAVDGWEEIE